jgi:hypothetical protein
MGPSRYVTLSEFGHIRVWTMNPLPKNLKKPTHSAGSFSVAGKGSLDALVLSCILHVGPIDMLLAGQSLQLLSTSPADLVASSVCIGPTLTFCGRSNSIVAAIGTGDIIKFNIDAKVPDTDTRLIFPGRAFIQGEFVNPNDATPEQVFVTLDRGAGSRVHRELFHHHHRKAKVLLLVPLDVVSDTFVSVDESGSIAYWQYSTSSYDSNGWMRPAATCSINLDFVELIDDPTVTMAPTRADFKDTDFPPMQTSVSDDSATTQATFLPAGPNDISSSPHHNFRLKSRVADRKGNIVEVFHPALVFTPASAGMPSRPYLCEVSRRFDIDLQRRKDQAKRRASMNIRDREKKPAKEPTEDAPVASQSGPVRKGLITRFLTRFRSGKSKTLEAAVAAAGDAPSSNINPTVPPVPAVSTPNTEPTPAAVDGSITTVPSEGTAVPHESALTIETPKLDAPDGVKQADTAAGELSVPASPERPAGTPATVQQAGSPAVAAPSSPTEHVTDSKKTIHEGAARRRASIAGALRRATTAAHEDKAKAEVGGSGDEDGENRGRRGSIMNISPIGWRYRAVRELRHASRIMFVAACPEGSELYFLAAYVADPALTAQKHPMNVKPPAKSSVSKPVAPVIAKPVGEDSMNSPRSPRSDASDGSFSPLRSPTSAASDNDTDGLKMDEGINSGSGVFYVVIGFDLHAKTLKLPYAKFALPPNDRVLGLSVGPLTTETLSRMIRVHTLHSIKLFSAETGIELTSAPPQAAGQSPQVFPINIREHNLKGSMLSSICASNRLTALGNVDDPNITGAIVSSIRFVLIITKSRSLCSDWLRSR